MTGFLILPVALLIIFKRAIFRIERSPAICFVKIASDVAAYQPANDNPGGGCQRAPGTTAELVADNTACYSADDRAALLAAAFRTASRKRQRHNCDCK